MSPYAFAHGDRILGLEPFATKSLSVNMSWVTAPSILSGGTFKSNNGQALTVLGGEPIQAHEPGSPASQIE